MNHEVIRLGFTVMVFIVVIFHCIGIIAVSCAELMSFDERVDNASRIIMTPSLILIWSFSDPIHPQVLCHFPFEKI